MLRVIQLLGNKKGGEDDAEAQNSVNAGCAAL